MAWLSVEIQERLSIVLAHFVWQGALIAALLAVTVSLLRVRRPNARYAASMVAFGLLMLSPVVTWFAAPDLGPRVERAVVEINEPAKHSPSLTHRVTEAGEGDATGRGVALPVSMEPRDVANVPIVVESPQPILAEATPQIIDKPKTAMWVERLRMWEPWIIRGWLTGVVLLSLRLLLGAVGLWRWRRATETLPDTLAPVVAQLCKAMQMAQPTVRLCRRVSEAVALGLFKPMILLPVSWATELPPDMLEAVLAHELAHVRRFDLWVNLLQRLVETLLFYHPAVWWLSRRLRIERELCCDDLAATVTNNRLRYAETLEHVARLSQSTSASSLALAMASRDGALLHRVRQLLDPLPNSRTRSAWWIGLLTLTLVLSLGLGAFLSSQAEVEATTVPSPSQLERGDNDDDEFKPEPVDEEAIRLRAVGQTQFLQADYAAMAESYAKLTDRKSATVDDHLWHGHAYQLARNWPAAVRAYHGALNKLDEQIAATEAELKVLEPKVKLDESIKLRKGNRYLPLKRDQEQLPKRWPSLILLVGHLELDELKNPAAAAKTLSRGLRFSPELAVPLRELLSSAEAAVTRQPKSEDHIRGMQAIMPLETQRYLAMAQEQLDQPAGAFDTWSRVRLAKLVFPSSYATSEPAHLKALASKLPQDALQPHHRFVLEHPDREPLKPREAKDFLKVGPANPFQARTLSSVEFSKLGPAASSLVQLPDGRLLMAFASGDQHHIGIKLVSSRDGKEWDALWEFAHNSVFDTRAPSLVVDDDGVIWMLCLSKRLTTERFASGPYELWLTHSRDGREWSPLRPLQFEPNKREGEAPAEPKLAQGQYQELVQLTRLPNRRFAVFHGSFLAVADSPSGLRTLSRIPLQDDKRHVNNPHATFDSEGRCHLVFDDFGRGLYYTRSTDLREWSPPQLLGTNEKNSSISHPQLLLANERVALIHEKNNGSWLQRGSIAENGLHLGEAVQITDHLMPLNGSRLLRVGNQILIPAGVAPYFPKLLSATVAELIADHNPVLDSTATLPKSDNLKEDVLLNTAVGPGNSRQAQVIKRAVAFLKAEQQVGGVWQGAFTDGITALAATALLQAGVKADDPVIQNALTHLRKVEPTQTYTVALQTIVFCEASAKVDAELIRRNVVWLEKAQVTTGQACGGWSYGADPGGRGDGSCSRFAVLGLDAAKKAGFAVQAETWQRVSDYWLTNQNDNGGWGYMPAAPSSLSMTLAGIAGLATANRHLPRNEQSVKREVAIRQPEKFIERALLGLSNVTKVPSDIYSLQSLERAGHLCDITRFGELHWKEFATKFLLEAQHPKGFWKMSNQGDVVATSLALLTLTGQPEPKVNANQQHNPALKLSASNQTQDAAIVSGNWGEVIKGLRVRVVPVLASMDEEAVDLEKRVTAFETLDDVAFAVEIENVSDQPKKLPVLRYGENYGDSKGKLASDWFGQFLFSIDYLDAAGKRIERPEVVPVRNKLSIAESGALKATLEPQQSVKMLLKPNRWISVLSQQPIVGKQRAIVRYRGAFADPEVEAIASAVEYTVTKRGYRPNGVPGLTLGDDPKNDPQLEPDITKQVVWGEPVNGLRAALDVVPERSRTRESSDRSFTTSATSWGSFSHGTKPKLKLLVQNVSDKPISLATPMWLSELPITAKNAVGEDIPIQSTWYTGVTPAIRVLLKPQQIVTFDAGNVGLAVTKERADAFEHVTHRRLVAPRGKYLLKGTEHFGTSFRLEDGKGNVTFPTDSDFKGDLTTGSAKIDLSNEIIEGEIVDAVTSKPVEGTTVSFMVVKPKTATSDEVTVANLIWGPKSPSKIYFTIPEVPEDIAQRADRDELEVRWGVGNHPDYENFSPADRIPLKEFFHEGPKTALRVLSKIKLTPKKKTAAVSFHLPEADQIEVERRFNAARKSIDRLTAERFEQSIDRLINESRDLPPSQRAGLMEKLMMEAHEWLGLEQAHHVGFDGTLFERVKHKCAMAGLARVDEVPAALTLRLLEFATASQLTMSTDSNPDWIAQRRLKTSMWLTQIERVRRVIDPNWDETDYPQITNGDIAPSDPQKRAEFEREVETNRLKAERYNEQITARRLLAQFTPRLEDELIRMYVRKPLDAAQFESLLQQHCSDPSQRERLAKTVRLFNAIIPGGTRLKYGWPDGLAEAGTSGVPQLMEAVRDKTYPKFIRHDGTWALGLIGDPRALPVLIEVAQDESTPEKYKNIAREFANTLTMAKQNSEPSNERAQTEAVDPNGEIVGVLLDEQGQSVKGATIACGAVINDSGRGGGANDVTDANGRYRLKVPSPGIYNVWLKKFESPRMTAIADDGLIVEGGKVTTSRMVLMAGTQFGGTLVDEQGQAVPDVTVYCNSLARPASAGVELVKTNEKGVFTFSLPPGRAYFYAHRNGATPEVRDAAKAIVTVPRNGDVPTKSTQPEPFKLVLKNSQPTALDSPEWIERSTPGTQVIHQAKANDVTGTVVDENGKPVSRAKVFRYDGPILEADDKGEFKVTSSRGTQFIMHAFAPGYHVWTGTPYSGAVLKIVLEKKPVEVKAALQKVTVPKAPEGGSALTPRPATQGMRVDVPNGVHLELVGLSTIHAGNRDADQRQWWDARGGVIGNTPNVLGEKRWMRALPEYSKGREVVVRMTAHSDSPFVEEFRRRAAWIIGEVDGVKSTPAVRIEGQTPPLLFHLAPNGLLQDGESVDVQLHSHFIPTAGATTTRLRFGFGHAATSQTYDDKGKLNSQTLVKEHPEIWHRFGLLRIEAKPEGVVVWTKPTRGLGDLGEGSVQLLLVDGTILNSMSPQLSEHGDEEQHLFKKIDAADVDGVTLRVLTLTHWVTFSGLPLNANATADAKAEVQTVAHNAEVVSRIDSATVVSADAAEFLKMIYKPNTSLRALRLGMNEVQFKAIMRECGIPMQTMRGDGSKVSYTIQTGYDRDILANFDNGKCEVIQPIPRAEWPKQVSFESLTVSFKYSFSGRPPEQITIKRNGDCFYQVDELPARGTIAKRPGARITSQVHPQRMLELERLLQETDWLVKKPDELPGPPRLHTEETPITVVRGGVTTTLKCVAPRDDLYRTLLWFLRGMAKQEQFIYAIDWNSDDATSRSLALHELRMDIEALEGQPGRSLPQYDLDYHRLLKTFGRILRNPNEQEDPLITAIKVASITREDSEFDAITRWRHDRSLNVRNVVAVAITEYAMGRKLSDRQLALLSEMVSSSEEARWGLIRLGDFAVPTIVKLIEPGSTETDIVSEQMVRAYLDHRKELTGPFDARLIAAVQSALTATKTRPSQRTKYYEEFLKWIESQPVKAPATESR